MSITDIWIFIHVANPFIGWRFWQKRWLPYYWGKAPDLLPLARDDAVLETSFSIEDFLVADLPGLIQKVEEQRPPVGKTIYFRLLKSHPLKLLLTVEYRPGVSGAALRRVSKSYVLLPVCIPFEQLITDKLSGWELEEAD